jgi:biuret amidohydrolase
MTVSLESLRRKGDSNVERAFGLEIPQSLEEACNPRRVALIVYDMQVGILRHVERSADLIANVVRVLQAARQAGVRVFFLRHMSLPKELMGVFQLRMALAWQRAQK